MNEDVKKGALGFPVNSPAERFFNGLIVENPTLVIVLGMCPTLAVTTSAINGLSMGLATTVVLALSNAVISLIRNIVPDTVRIPSFIVVIASFVTMVDMIMAGYFPALYAALGVYIPLIVVNCIIFGRAEAYASKNGVVPSFFDGIGMGLGFTCAITVMGLIRELIGAGTIFEVQVLGEGGAISAYTPISIFIQQPGAFLTLACMVATMNYVKLRMAAKGKDTSKFREPAEEESKVAEAAIKAKEAEAKAKAEVKEKAAEVKAEAKEKAAEAKAEAEEKAAEAKEKAAEVKDEVKEKAAKVKEEAKEKAAEIKKGGEEA